MTETSPYTSVLDITHNEVTLQVRVYHDARMAEVIAAAHYRHLRSHYDYPNRNMFQPDEKSQLNHLLGDWLAHCLRHGHSVEDIAFCG